MIRVRAGIGDASTDQPHAPTRSHLAVSLQSRANRAPPTREGFLSKKSGGNKRKSKWDRRWCELSDTAYIHYYKKEGGKNAGSVFLKGAHVMVDTNDAENRTFLVETVRVPTMPIMAASTPTLCCISPRL